MSMRLMKRLLHAALMMMMMTAHCSVCVGPHRGGGQDPNSCEAALMVRRGSALLAAPGQSVTLRCPVRLCGEPLRVTWCKLLDDTDTCGRIKDSERVETRWSDEHVVSSLTLKNVSVLDSGLYRCSLEKNGSISHSMNLSVSELHEGVKNLNSDEDEAPPVARDDDVASWLPYFSICVSVALLVATLTVFTLLKLHGWRRILSHTDTKGQEMSTHMIPDLPKGCDPPTLFLHTYSSFPGAMNRPSAADGPPSQPPPAPATYAVISHRRSETPAGDQPAVTDQHTHTHTHTDYAAIRVS